MSWVALVLKSPLNRKAAIVGELRKLNAMSITDANAFLASEKPMILGPLFSRADPKLARRLACFLNWLENNSVTYDAYQVLKPGELSPKILGGCFKLNASVLDNLIATRTASLESQREFGPLQDGVDDS